MDDQCSDAWSRKQLGLRIFVGRKAFQQGINWGWCFCEENYYIAEWRARNGLLRSEPVVASTSPVCHRPLLLDSTIAAACCGSTEYMAESAQHSVVEILRSTEAGGNY